MPFLTPPEPSAWIVIQASIPDTLYASVLGALYEMCGVDVWQLSQGLTVEICDQMAMDIIDSITYIEPPPPWFPLLGTDDTDFLADSNGSPLTEG